MKQSVDELKVKEEKEGGESREMRVRERTGNGARWDESGMKASRCKRASKQKEEAAHDEKSGCRVVWVLQGQGKRNVVEIEKNNNII